MKARIQGVSAQIKKFDFFFGVSLGYLIMRHTENRSRMRRDVSSCRPRSNVLNSFYFEIIP